MPARPTPNASGTTGSKSPSTTGSPGIASAAPAVLPVAVAGATTTNRIGSAGVMLPHHQPLVVAEEFATLSAFAPCRVDLGLGRSPGFTTPVRQAFRQTQRDFAVDLTNCDCAVRAIGGRFGRAQSRPRRGMTGCHRCTRAAGRTATARRREIGPALPTGAAKGSQTTAARRVVVRLLPRSAALA